MKLNQSLLIFAGAILMPCVSLFAQDSDVPAKENNPASAEEKGEAAKSGEAVLVSAAKHEMEMTDVPMSVSVVSGDEVMKSSAATIAELADDVPGVQVSSNGMSGFKQVNIRGEANSRVLILVDGQKVSEQKSMDGSPLLISPQDVERIEVIKGPASVLYGSEAIGGVVNVITKKGAKREGVHGSAGVRTDSATNGVDQFYTITTTYDALEARISYSDEDHGNIESPDGEIKNSDYRIQNTSAFLSYAIDENTRIGARFEMFRGRTNVVTGSEDIRMSLPDWNRDKVGLFFEKKDISDTLLKFRVDGYFQKTDKNFLQGIAQSQSGYNPMFGNYVVNVDTNAERVNKLYTYGLDAQADISFDDSQYLIFGTQISVDDLDSDEVTSTLVNASFMPARPMSDKTKYNAYNAKVITAAIYAQNEWEFSEGWNLVLGARGTTVRNEIKNSATREVDNSKGTTAITALDGEDSDSNATFSASLVNTQIEDWTFRATIAQGYRYANINQLYIGSAMASNNTEPNPDLKPEQSISYELGVRYDDGALTLDATAFYTDAEDYIGTEYLGSGPGAMYNTDNYRFVNYDKAKTYGVEFSASYDYEITKSSKITPYAVATYLRRRFEDASGSTYNTGQPSLFGKVGVRGTLAEGSRSWWTDLNMRANSDCKDDAGNNYAGWATFNVAIGVDITPERKNPYFGKLGFAIGIDNIGDARYELANVNFLQPGRSYWASLKYEF